MNTVCGLAGIYLRGYKSDLYYIHGDISCAGRISIRENVSLFVYIASSRRREMILIYSEFFFFFFLCSEGTQYDA